MPREPPGRGERRQWAGRVGGHAPPKNQGLTAPAGDGEGPPVGKGAHAFEGGTAGAEEEGGLVSTVGLGQLEAGCAPDADRAGSACAEDGFVCHTGPLFGSEYAIREGSWPQRRSSSTWGSYFLWVTGQLKIDKTADGF